MLAISELRMDNDSGVSIPPLDTGFIARQAVFDRGRAVWGYELFYRHKLSRARSSAAEHRMLLGIATSAFLSPQWQQQQDSFLIVHLDPRIFAEDVTGILPRGRTVFQVREAVLASKPLQDFLARLRGENYRIAVYDFEGRMNDPAVLDLVDLVAVDMLRPDREELITRAVLLGAKRRGLEILATKVEDMDAFNQARSAGCTLFQGFFFQKPEEIRGKALPAALTSSISILRLLEDEDPDINELARAIQRDVTLSYRLLKFLNSPYFGFMREVSSIKLALILAGWRQMRTWLRLVLITGLAPTGKPGELAFLSAQRGRFLELAAERALGRANGPEPERLLLLGLFSLLDSLFDMPMQTIVGSLPLDPELKQTLCGEPTELAPWLQLVAGFERADWDGLPDLFERLGADPVVTASCYTQSMQWAHAIFNYLN